MRLDHRLDEVKTVKNVIERDIRNEYAGIMERLKSAEGVKTAVLQHDIAEIQKDITRIDEILMFMEEIATGANAPKPAPAETASAAAEPPELPPGTQSVAQGFFTAPKKLVSLEEPIANSSILHLPSMTAPSAFILETTVAS